MRARPVTALLAMAFVALAPPAQAFASLPPGSSPHDGITEDGARLAGFPADAARALAQAVREPDFQESEAEPRLDDLDRTDADHEYEPGHHCDRVAPMDDAAAFNGTVAYVRGQRAQAVTAAGEGRSDDAVAALGKALHALQDCYSHTNVVDLGGAAWASLEHALVGNGSMVPGLRLVAYEPGADEPGRPEGDPYGHDDFAKDSPGMNEESKARLPDGRTKHEAARDLATNATAAFLRDVLASLPPPAREDLMRQNVEDAGLPDDVPVPALPAAFALLAVGYAAVAFRWRR